MSIVCPKEVMLLSSLTSGIPVLSMEQDDRSYDSADGSPPSYAYTGQPHRGTPQTYYELAQMMEQSLSTQYPESSQRSVTHSTPYPSAYHPSPFRGQSYGLPNDPFHNGLFQRASLDNPPSRGLQPFSDLAVEANSNALRAEAELYRSSTPRTTEVDRAYVSDATYITQHSTSTNPFTFSSVPSNSYMQVIQPSVGSGTGPTIDRHLSGRGDIPHALFTGQSFTPRQLLFDQKHMYTSKADVSNVSVPDSPIKLANLDDPQPSLSSSHQYSNSGTNAPLSDTVSPPVAIPKKKKSKMHDCEICHKKFPR